MVHFELEEIIMAPRKPDPLRTLNWHMSRYEKNKGHLFNCNNAGLRDEHVPRLVAFLKNHPEITSVFLSHNTISNAGACQIAELESVQYLDLSNNQIKDEGIKALVANTHIKSLLLDSNSISKTCAEFLLEGDRLTHLEYFKIGRNLLQGDYPDLFKQLHKMNDSLSSQSSDISQPVEGINSSSTLFHHNTVASKGSLRNSNNHRLIPTQSS